MITWRTQSDRGTTSRKTTTSTRRKQWRCVLKNLFEYFILSLRPGVFQVWLFFFHSIMKLFPHEQPTTVMWLTYLRVLSIRLDYTKWNAALIWLGKTRFNSIQFWTTVQTFYWTFNLHFYDLKLVFRCCRIKNGALFFSETMFSLKRVGFVSKK